MRIVSSSFALFGAVLLTTGCASSQTARIEEKPGVFRDLTHKVQKEILAGKIEVGFTPDMVYLALGKPSVVNKVNESGAVTEEWVYDRYIGHSPRLVTGVVTAVPTYIPNEVYAIRARPGPGNGGHGEEVRISSDELVYTLQIRFNAGKVAWMKLT